MSDRPLRADARRSRHAIVEAYKTLAMERGADVPLYEVARAANVGQGTLYRHFPSRSALAGAVFSEVIDRFETLAAMHVDEPDLFDRLLDAALQGEIDMHGLSRVMVSADSPELVTLQRRTAELFSAPLEAAKRAGRVRPDLDVTDITVMLSMVDGVMNGTGSPDERRAAAQRARGIISTGVRARED